MTYHAVISDNAESCFVTDERNIFDSDLPKAVAFSDPMSVVFELNSEMLLRINRIRYVLVYAYWAGVAVAILSVIYFIWTVFTEVNYINLGGTVLIIVLSIIACHFARQQKPFLDEYKVLAGAVDRAKDWIITPPIPEGDSHVNRLLRYLESTDERFAYYIKKPGYLRRNETVKTKDGQNVRFDAVLEGSSFPWHPVVENVRVLIRVVPVVTRDEVARMVRDAELALKRIGRTRWEFKPGPARILLIQTERGNFDSEAIEAANTTWVHYQRTVGGTSYEWSSPVELIAESADGRYNQGTVCFG